MTGLCGPTSVAATTVAVEKVVLRHLDARMRLLRQTDVVAFEIVSAGLHDERTHHDRAAIDTPPGCFWMGVLMPIVSGATEAVIWLGMKL
jgi:3-demethoxyubiquinol 3-hydroxylase